MRPAPGGASTRGRGGEGADEAEADAPAPTWAEYARPKEGGGPTKGRPKRAQVAGAGGAARGARRGPMGDGGTDGGRDGGRGTPSLRSGGGDGGLDAPRTPIVAASLSLRSPFARRCGEGGRVVSVWGARNC